MSMDERDIERLARELGRERARQVQADRVAATVAARLLTGEQVPRPPRPLARWGLVAAAVLTVAVVADALIPGAIPTTVSVAVPAALGDLDGDDLDAVLDSLVYTAPASEFVGWGVGTMTAEELESLLTAMEG